MKVKKMQHPAGKYDSVGGTVGAAAVSSKHSGCSSAPNKIFNNNKPASFTSNLNYVPKTTTTNQPQSTSTTAAATDMHYHANLKPQKQAAHITIDYYGPSNIYATASAMAAATAAGCTKFEWTRLRLFE